MKKYLSGFISALIIIGMAFASYTIYDSLTVNGEVNFTGLPLDGEYPPLTIDSGGRVYEEVLIRGNIYFTGQYLITTTGAATDYPLAGAPIEQPILIGFVNSGYDWVYQGPDSLLLFLYTASVGTDTNNTTIQMNLLFNGADSVDHKSISKIDSTTATINLSSTASHMMTSGDVISIVVRSDKAGAVLNFENFSASAFRF